YDFPLQGRHLYSGDTTRTVAWRVIAYCSDSTTSANVRTSDGGGVLSTIAIPTGSQLLSRPMAYPTTGGAPATFAVDAVDPTESDGLRGSAWDDHTIEVQRTAGSGTVYIVGVSVGEWPDVWMP